MKTRQNRILVAALLAAVLVSLPDSALAAEPGGDKWGVWLTIGRFFNLAVLIGILVRVGRKPVSAFFASRAQSIRERIAQAEAARRAAEAKLAEMEARMSGLDREIGELRAAAESAAAEEARRLLAEAERDAEKIVSRARVEIQGMTRAAQLELRSHAAELSVGLAESLIRREINDDDRKRLFGRFVATIEKGKEKR